MYNSDLPTRAELPSTAQLIRSTLIAAVVAVILLITIVLPAEYGIDPSGMGNLLGLKKMGEIKVSLEQEAATDSPATQAPKAAPVVKVEAVADVQATAKTSPLATQETSHQKSIALKPGEAAEMKLTMKKGAKVVYQWTAAGGPVNYDTHGDSSTLDYFGYGKGRQVKGDKGELTAEFDGNHGWFWRNRSASVVTISLSTQGDYQSIQRKM